MKNFLRNLFYPGLDLHTRNRASLCRFWKNGTRDFLDAGCGNGYFSWLAYRSGANVVGLNFEPGQVVKAKQFLIGYRKADPDRLTFEEYNLYNLSNDGRKFDEIVCFEVLEHLKRDMDVVKSFSKLLNPGGLLHVCCPNKHHPRHQAEVLDESESGGHVRPGYDEADYREMMQACGLQVEKIVGIGTPSVYFADAFLRTIRSRVGDWAALPFFYFFLPVVWFARFNPKVPFSLYVQARKPVT
jgi:SAM-dependent methyltransferase